MERNKAFALKCSYDFLASSWICSFVISKRLKSETQSLNLSPMKAYTRTVSLCFLESPSQLKNLISRMKLWQNNLESFPVNLYCKSLPFASVSSNHLVTFRARNLLFTSNRRAFTSLLKPLSFEHLWISCMMQEGLTWQWTLSINPWKKVARHCFSGVMALHGSY